MYGFCNVIESPCHFNSMLVVGASFGRLDMKTLYCLFTELEIFFWLGFASRFLFVSVWSHFMDRHY